MENILVIGAGKPVPTFIKRRLLAYDAIGIKHIIFNAEFINTDDEIRLINNNMQLTEAKYKELTETVSKYAQQYMWQNIATELNVIYAKL